MTLNKNYLLDLAERAVSTYLESFFGLLIAANLFTGSTAGKATSLISVLQVAAVSALPAALAVVKGGIAGLWGKADASVLPITADPTPPTPPVAVPVVLPVPAYPPAGAEIDVAALIQKKSAEWRSIVQAINAAPGPLPEPPAGG